jgi:hypothetical protein
MFYEYKIDTGLCTSKTVKSQTWYQAWDWLAKMLHDHYKETACGVLLLKVYVSVHTNKPDMEDFLSSKQEYWQPVAVGCVDRDYKGKKWKVEKK